MVVHSGGFIRAWPLAQVSYRDLHNIALILCKGSMMLPMHNQSATDKMQLRSCTQSFDCESENQFYPDTYCSILNQGDKKFCCPVPYSKSFRDAKQFLLPTKILQYHNIDKIVDMQSKLDGNTDEFSKSCMTNADCGEEEFCDDVVHREEKGSVNVDKMISFKPKICFPAPRCAGRAVRVPEELGIKQCKQSSECGMDAFCDIKSNENNEVKAFSNIGICCKYDCTADAMKTFDVANTSIKSYAKLTASGALCNVDSDCVPESDKESAKCVEAQDQGTPIEPLKKGVPMKLCCHYPKRSLEDLYQCIAGSPNLDRSGRVLKCNEDKDCNKVEGQTLSDPSKWDYECVSARDPGDKFCCPVAKCNDRHTYMKTEIDCKTTNDCMKDEEESKTNPEGRAVCSEFYVKNKKKSNKKCCPIGDLSKQLPYCTKRNCTSSSDCVAASSYCHPKKKTCCYVGITRIDGRTHVNSTVCQGTCPDKEVIVRDKSRQVDPVLKTSLIISIIMTLVFAFLALIMFVNYRSKNFCDKYTPKKKKKGKKGKKEKSDTTTGGKSTKGDTSTSSAISGTGTTGGGTTGGGTTGDGTGA
ncbi:hypothetical protein KIN20_011216 [Parelaphostrongylus tenuis]|uniref:Uncharacterized protein n=1 Tax=Parelaphostrongylus tenuis TaxID=148309 RepID=A0AAD5MV36_PARTN|nr:hypothetical protein KIN20_011216 [Parelaphostrongylus tenuis]